MAFIDVLFLCLAVILIHGPEFVEPVVLPSVVMRHPKPVTSSDPPKPKPLTLTRDGQLEWCEETMSIEQWQARASAEIGENDILSLRIDMSQNGEGNLQSFIALQIACAKLGIADKLKIPAKENRHMK